MVTVGVMPVHSKFNNVWLSWKEVKMKLLVRKSRAGEPIPYEKNSKKWVDEYKRRIDRIANNKLQNFQTLKI